MGLASFLNALFEHGRVRVGPPDTVGELTSHEDRSAGEALLREREAATRLEFPGEAPAYEPELGLWGAEQFYRACQFTVYREVPAEAIAAAFAEPCPAADPAARHYHVDLTFRFLPDLARLVRSAATHDPLGDHLRTWANQWPLSSVGMSSVEPAANEPAWDCPGLLRCYVDRIIAARDVSRLADPRVHRALRRALGYHEQLAPQLAVALAKYDRDSATEAGDVTDDIIRSSE